MEARYASRDKIMSATLYPSPTLNNAFIYGTLDCLGTVAGPFFITLESSLTTLESSVNTLESSLATVGSTASEALAIAEAGQQRFSAEGGTISIVNPVSLIFGSGFEFSGTSVTPTIVQQNTAGSESSTVTTNFGSPPAVGNTLVAFTSGSGVTTGCGIIQNAGWTQLEGYAHCNLFTKTSVGAADQSIYCNNSDFTQLTILEIANSYGYTNNGGDLVGGSTLNVPAATTLFNALLLTFIFTGNTGITFSSAIPAGSNFVYNQEDGQGFTFALVETIGNGSVETVGVTASGSASNVSFVQIQLAPNPADQSASINLPIDFSGSVMPAATPSSFSASHFIAGTIGTQTCYFPISFGTW
jgi:hypothetical protein